MGLEVERTYDAPGNRPLPDLTSVAGVTRVRRLDDEHLQATYHDTDDLRLARSRATLRRRTGGRDAGWHLKLPAGRDARHEITAAGGSASVPVELRALLRSRTREAPLSPVVRMRTLRQVHQLLDSSRRVLAEVADDRVDAERSGTPIAWREVEVELVEGDVEVLDAVEEILVAWGASRSPWQSKLRRALGDALVEPPLPEPGTAGRAVLAHLREHVGELVARDPMVRRDEPDAVHKMRVATRRLRSALKTFRPLLDSSVTDPLRDELRHLAGVLGEARDAEVLRDRLAAQLAAEPPELVVGPVRRRIRDELQGRYRAAHGAAVAELDGERYLALLERLDALVTAPPWTSRVDRPGAQELPRLVRRAWRRLRAAHAAAGLANGDERLELLHEVRKAAKQARYAAEAVAPALGPDAAAFAVRVEAVQEVLGEHQDSVVSRQVLLELAQAADSAGESAFTFGRLHGLEELRSERALAAFEPAWRELDRRRARAWMRPTV